MQNKITQFLRSLTKHELNEFGKFVSSPFHNNRKDVIRYYKIIRKYHPGFAFDEKAKVKIYGQLYPGKKYDSNTLILLNSFLYNLGKKYMAISDLMDDKFSFSHKLLRNLEKHNSGSLFEKEYKNIEHYFKDEKFNKELFQKKAMMEELKIDYNLKRNRHYKICQNDIDYSEYLIFSFIVNLAIAYHDLFVDKSAYNCEFNDPVIEQFIKHFNFEEFIERLNKVKNEKYEHLMYYYYLLMCNYYPEKDIYYPKLKQYTLTNFDKLHREEKVRRFNYLMDYCIYKIKTGNSKFLSESFNIHKETLRLKLYRLDPNDESIGLIFFRNFVMVGLAAKEYNFVEEFISRYSGDLDGDAGKDLFEISSAMLYYEKRDYGKALEYLSKVQHSHPIFRLDTKHLSAKIYYTINDYSSFFSLIDAYKHFLKNDKSILPRVKQHHSTFINYTARLGKIKSSGNDVGLFLLKKEINDNQNMDFRHKMWLIEKAGEIVPN